VNDDPDRLGERLRKVYRRLLKAYGPQHWWPGDSRFEIMVGAVLTQNTAWTNVERASANLRRAGLLDARAIATAESPLLADLIRPVGYFNVKARRLQNLCRFVLEGGGESALARQPTEELRRRVLGVNGVGPETADDILLYAFGRPVFVIDAYTRRILQRLGLVDGGEGYEDLRARLESALEPDAALFNEYHALIVHHAKHCCRKRPSCSRCVLWDLCPHAAALQPEGPPSGPDLVIRTADYGDPVQARAIVELLDSYARDPAGGGEPLPQASRERLPACLAEIPGALSLLAYVGGEPVGLANCFQSFSTFACRPILNLHDLTVLPPWRGRGIGRALLRAVESSARERGCCKLTLEVLTGNGPARGLYSSLGFAPYRLEPEFGQAEFWEKKLVKN